MHVGRVTHLPDVLRHVEATIRRLALDSANVFMTKHAVKRLVERNLTMTQVYRCLQNGALIDGPTLDSEQQKGWKFSMQILSGGDWVKVVCKLIETNDSCILVITVI